MCGAAQLMIPLSSAQWSHGRTFGQSIDIMA